MIFSLSTTAGSKGRSFVNADTIVQYNRFFLGKSKDRQIDPVKEATTLLNEGFHMERIAYLQYKNSKDALVSMLSKNLYNTFVIQSFVLKGSESDNVGALLELEKNIKRDGVDAILRENRQLSRSRLEARGLYILSSVCIDGSKESAKALAAFKSANFDCSTEFTTTKGEICVLCFKSLARR